MDLLLGHAITYCVVVGPNRGRKVFTLQTQPAMEATGPFTEIVAPEAGFSLHAGVVAKSHERTKRERLCRYIMRPPVPEARLSLTLQGHIRYQLKTPYRLDLQIGLGVLDRWTCAGRRVLADACGCRGR